MADELDGSATAGAPRDPAPTRFTHAGATLVAEEQGEGERVFLLIHGVGMGRSVFRGLVELLSAHGRVIAIDQPGYGEAPEPMRTLTMERTADLVAAFVRWRMLPPVVVIGHSMGTQVALELAVRHPGLVDRLVLVAPTVNVAERTARRQLLRLVQDLAVESPLVVLRGAREYLRAGPHLARKMRAMLVHRPEDRLPHVTVPTLVLRGAEDRVCPVPWCRRVAGAIPGAWYEEIPGHGHETMIRDPQAAAARIVSFASER
ncbi:alpha/beta hydrolase [Microbacterium protaetiae]|uniref:Alpha/beta hydrolase n=1 Tax=Microbacterium protaetiae TaxID=2509458 RepID=A0A4P6EG26_9MICO|nr:alpha/beta hydrolase [Microbacterium protaetiae]QAY60373.1 alpha/beta hydrolase [Microbacterium protaetiae]